MRKRKTEQEKQQQCDRLIRSINDRIGELHGNINEMYSRKEKIRRAENRLDDPHAVVPKSYRTMDG